MARDKRARRAGKTASASIPENSKLYAAAVVAAAHGENPAKALDSLEATTRQRPQDLELKYAAAKALAMVSKALVAHDPVEGRKLAAPAQSSSSRKSSRTLTPIWRESTTTRPSTRSATIRRSGI